MAIKASLSNQYTKVITVGDKSITLQVGLFSEQASGAVLATCGDTVVHATVVIEKLYAVGRIKGSRWVKRDGRPNDQAILKGRLIDRTIRPLFPSGLKNEIQAVATVLSVDGVNDPDMVAMVGISAALTLSKIPFEGPVGGVRVGFNTETQQFIINPTYEELETSSLDLIVSGTKEAIVMVEAGAKEVDESTMVGAFEIAQKSIAQIADAIEEMRLEIGDEKLPVVVAEPNTALKNELKKKYGISEESYGLD